MGGKLQNQIYSDDPLANLFLHVVTLAIDDWRCKLDPGAGTWLWQDAPAILDVIAPGRYRPDAWRRWVIRGCPADDPPRAAGENGDLPRSKEICVVPTRNDKKWSGLYIQPRRMPAVKRNLAESAENEK